MSTFLRFPKALGDSTDDGGMTWSTPDPSSIAASMGVPGAGLSSAAGFNWSSLFGVVGNVVGQVAPSIIQTYGGSVPRPIQTTLTTMFPPPPPGSPGSGAAYYPGVTQPPAPSILAGLSPEVKIAGAIGIGYALLKVFGGKRR